MFLSTDSFIRAHFSSPTTTTFLGISSKQASGQEGFPSSPPVYPQCLSDTAGGGVLGPRLRWPVVPHVVFGSLSPWPAAVVNYFQAVLFTMAIQRFSKEPTFSLVSCATFYASNIVCFDLAGLNFVGL
ncbi:hypothetical protein B0H17DRAFT_1134058 [Mycena rosella]|uniref:Uncharacterized protein n=1 Tax=Mycena rosella TaxID=1033263 RepID=A0AAD7DIL4_MYCRO|nr:hypothetical protein B0H17DRAFT_1134058 [Mycena rosella]